MLAEGPPGAGSAATRPAVAAAVRIPSAAMTTDRGVIDGAAPDRDALLQAAEVAETEGRLLDAIDALTAANRCERDGEIEQRLVGVAPRGLSADRRSSRAGRVAARASPIPSTGRLLRARCPRSSGAQLTAAILGGAIRHHGALLVRGSDRPRSLDRLREDVDRAFEASRDESRGHAGGGDRSLVRALPLRRRRLRARSGRHGCGGSRAEASPPSRRRRRCST